MKNTARENGETYADRGLRDLRRAVREEFERKSKLGQYVIVSRDGKTVRMLASEVLKEEANRQALSS